MRRSTGTCRSIHPEQRLMPRRAETRCGRTGQLNVYFNWAMKTPHCTRNLADGNNPVSTLQWQHWQTRIAQLNGSAIDGANSVPFKWVDWRLSRAESHVP